MPRLSPFDSGVDDRHVDWWMLWGFVGRNRPSGEIGLLVLPGGCWRGQQIVCEPLAIPYIHRNSSRILNDRMTADITAASLISRIAAELKLPTRSVSSVSTLLAEGATVPFIARYRKEATGSLDEVTITTIRDRAAQLLELESRRTAILKSLEERD